MAALEPRAVAASGFCVTVATQRRQTLTGSSMIMGSFDHMATETAHDHEVAREGARGLAISLEPLISRRILVTSGTRRPTARIRIHAS